jgi:tetratricopeptide (TPR) repeat protein
VDLLAGGLFVFRGQFDLALASATGHAAAASQLVLQGKLPEALQEAQTAVGLAPNDVGSQVALGDVLTQLNRKDEAKLAYQRALTLAETVCPEFQIDWLQFIQKKIAAK